MPKWLNETLYAGWGQRFAIKRVLAREQSKYQEVVVVETRTHGRVLVLDGNVQLTEADEFVYQEMLAHVPLLCHAAPHRVLIIGAGDGGVLRRVLQHSTVEQVALVEIDEAVVRLSRKHLPAIGGDAWDDPRATVIIGDGIQHVASTPAGTYDVIIVDSTDPVSMGEALFTTAFYADCARAMHAQGVIVNQCGVPFMQPAELRETSLRRARSFPHVTAYVAAVPTYVGGLMALGFASMAPGMAALSVETIRTRGAAAGVLGTTRYWSPEIHTAAFVLPPYIAEQLPGADRT